MQYTAQHRTYLISLISLILQTIIIARSDVVYCKKDRTTTLSTILYVIIIIIIFFFFVILDPG